MGIAATLLDSIGLRVKVFNATLTIFQLYGGGQFYWWRKPEYPGKPPTCHKLYVVSSTPHLSLIQAHNVSGYRN